MTRRMHKLLSSAFVFLGTVSSSAFAQCATGVNTGGGNCVPPDAPGMPGYDAGYENRSTQAAAPIWADSWGAIAIDERTGDAGTITDRTSRREADDAAMADCSSGGALNCKVMLTYKNQCAAIAWGTRAANVASNPSKDGAQADAMENCGRKASDCKVVYSACTTAKRVR